MWDRKSLKEKAKQAFTANYWKCVLVALVLGLTLGGGGGSSAGSNSFNQDDVQDMKDTFEDSTEVSVKQDISNAIDGIKNDSSISKADIAAVAATVGVVVLVIVVVALVIGFCITAFLLNPLQVGCRKFFVDNLDGTAQIGQMGLSFGSNYMAIVKTMFFRDLYILLWSLLLIIPGIIKAYEYMLVPYLLGEDPTMDTNEALLKSKEMMDGHKWNTFVLHLSFIGWELLSLLTCGILSIFYVNPYVYQTEAALYSTLSNRSGNVTDTYETYVEM